MRILIYSSFFYPSIGGLEGVMSNLAYEFTKAGHSVKVVTQTPHNQPDKFFFEIIRCPTRNQFLAAMRWCDVCLHGCVSLKALWPFLWVRKPLAITHQTWYRYPGTKLTLPVALKQAVSRFATNIAPSQAIADHLPAPATVIPNSYRDEIFYERPEIQRDRDLAFLGRLVSDKGADLLLNSLALLKQQGLQLKLTIIGQGPEENHLQQQAKSLGISEQVNFVGVVMGEALARLLNAHKILVVPSRWQEPFGIVALEGIACGCVVVGSDQGGLKDAIGPCGVTFPNGDLTALTQVLTDLNSNDSTMEMYHIHRTTHLAKHRQDAIAKAYLQVLEGLEQWT